LADGMVVRAPAPPPPPPVVDRCAPGPWTGFYVGGNLGWAHLDGEFNDHDHFFSDRRWFDDDEDAFTAGVQTGYNLQCGNVVFGVEGDINWAGFDDDNDHFGHFRDGKLKRERFKRDRSMDWFGTIRGRLGWASDRIMVYATAGAAYTELDRGHRGPGRDWNSDLSIWGWNDHHDDSDDVNWGWTAGGGVEWLWSPNLSFKAEALWIDFEDGDNDRDIKFHANHKGTLVTWHDRKRFDHDDDMVVVRVGLNYKFGYRAPPPYEPLK
ncbi:MAG TPA: outer membrane beta-barrel protein, partial [Hyphomicrobiaceae bacterium]